MSDNELLPRAFHVAAVDDDFDVEIPPTSGLEYLRRVQLEARRCPSVVVAAYDPSLFQKRQTVKVTAGSGLQPAPAGYSPSVPWQRAQAESFSRLRQKLARYKARVKREGCTASLTLPHRDNVAQWCKLCFGRFRASPAEEEDSSQDPVPDSSATPPQTDRLPPDEDSLPPDADSCVASPPLLSIITRMDQPTVIKVLEYHCNWLEATGFSEDQGQWFYALLVNLEKPLVPEACSLLRTLARNCANIRAILTTNSDSRLTPMNLLICLVARYFDQTDLVDDVQN